jgi:hypothetical protein
MRLIKEDRGNSDAPQEVRILLRVVVVLETLIRNAYEVDLRTEFSAGPFSRF